MLLTFTAIVTYITYNKRNHYNYPIEDHRDYKFRSEMLLNRRKRVERILQQCISDNNLPKQMQAYHLLNTLDHLISNLYKPNPFIHDLHTRLN